MDFKKCRTVFIKSGIREICGKLSGDLIFSFHALKVRGNLSCVQLTPCYVDRKSRKATELGESVSSCKIQGKS